MRAIFALVTVVLIAACGANGQPVRPSMNAGVAVSNGGISTATSVGFDFGKLNLSLGLGG